MTDIGSRIKSIQGSIGKSRIPDVDLPSLEKALFENENALGYLKQERGLTEETIKHFRLGYDKKRNLIAMPIFKNGDVIDIKYRGIDKKSYIRERGTESWIFNEDGIEHGKKTGGVLIVEGEIDAMTVWQAGIRNVISPTSGASSIGRWIDMLDTIPKVYISFDNDEPGKKASRNLSERLGVEKSWEVKYPNGIKDANEFFKKHDVKQYKELIRNAKVAVSKSFPHISDIVEQLRNETEPRFEIPYLDIPVEDGWVVIMVGKDNSGKSLYAVHIATSLIKKDIPTLLLPFERGTLAVGKRTITAEYNIDKLSDISPKRWDEIGVDVAEWPLYFYEPKGDEWKEEVLRELMFQAKRYFGIEALVVDHLDYLVQRDSANSYDAQGMAVRTMKDTALETGQMVYIAHQARKVDAPASKYSRDIRKEDASGSHKVFNISEIVLLIHDRDTHMTIEVAKNKGPMKKVDIDVNKASGKIIGFYDHIKKEQDAEDKNIKTTDTGDEEDKPLTIPW